MLRTPPQGATALILEPHWRGRDKSKLFRIGGTADDRDFGASQSRARKGDNRLSESQELLAALEYRVVASRVVSLTRIDAATLFGSGVVDSIATLLETDEIALVLVDAALTAIQQRNLERRWECRVFDRTELIVEIFRRRALSREGRIQVSLAALTYQKSRLVRSWTHLERQRGSASTVSGPGETQIETDRRLIDRHIGRLQTALNAIRRTRQLHRRHRLRRDFVSIALVGYTNAGKSTLFNRLTGATTLAESAVFATLDTTVRKMPMPNGRDVMLFDTVGFIADLPPQLIEAFKATLEEIVFADFIVHVRDIAHPYSDEQSRDVRQVLTGLFAGEERLPPMIEVWNKIDQLDTEARALALQASALIAGKADDIPLRPHRACLLSATSGEGIGAFTEVLGGMITPDETRYEIILDPSRGDVLSWLHRRGRVSGQRLSSLGIELTVELNPIALAQFRKRHRNDGTCIVK